MRPLSISVIVPSYQREEVLVETVRLVARQLEETDEIVIVDQTPHHQSATLEGLERLARESRVRWYRKGRASICEAMNVGARLARNGLLLFLDDDVVPAANLLAVYREEFSGPGSPLAMNGQVLQPWHAGPVSAVVDFELHFDFAYDRSAEVGPVATGNFAVLREVFLDTGGMDERFEGGAYRCDADLGYRLRARTGRPARFEPKASVRHLQAGGGTRAHGAKDSWASIDSAVGDHYLGLRWFGWRGAPGHSLRRLRRATLNRRTVRRPWLIPWLALREGVAFVRAFGRAHFGAPRLVRPLETYVDLEER